MKKQTKALKTVAFSLFALTFALRPVLNVAAATINEPADEYGDKSNAKLWYEPVDSTNDF